MEIIQTATLTDILMRSATQPAVQNFAPQWKELDLDWRPSFRDEIDRIPSESEAESEENEQ